MQPYREPTASTIPVVYTSSTPGKGNSAPEEYAVMPPRHVHHDATMFKPIPDADYYTSSSSATTSNGISSTGAAGSALKNNKKFLSDNSKRRRVEELQRTIELTDRLQRDADTTVLGSKVAIAMESVAVGICGFLINFGVRFSNPQHSFFRRFADTNIRLARMGSFYSVVGMGGMMMSLTYIPMEWQAIENANLSLEKLYESQQKAIKQRDTMLEEMAQALGMSNLGSMDEK